MRPTHAEDERRGSLPAPSPVPGCAAHLPYPRRHCVGMVSPLYHLAWDTAVSYSQRKAMVPGRHRNKIQKGEGQPRSLRKNMEGTSLAVQWLAP